MKIWYQDRPAFLGSTTELPGTLMTTAAGTFVVRDSDGLTLGIDPTGAYQYSDRQQAYELCTVDSSINVLRFTGSGVSFAVAYRAR